MKCIKGAIFLISLIVLFSSCDQNQQVLSMLNYSSEEIFPIKIDKYGIPNVKIEFRNNPVWIQWDTGDMVGLVLSKKIIHKSAITVLDSIQLRDSEGLAVGFSHRYIADSIKIFDKVYPDMIISTGYGDYNGLIGPRFIKLTRFTLDYKNKIIGISQSHLPENKMTGEKLTMMQSEKFPRLIIVEGVVNGKNVWVELDTGKSRTVVDPALVEELNLHEGKKGVMIENLALGKIKLEINNGKLKSFKGISRSLTKPIRMGLGSDILSKYIVTVDYEQGIVVLNSKK